MEVEKVEKLEKVEKVEKVKKVEKAEEGERSMGANSDTCIKRGCTSIGSRI